jgi:hypothetical protein
MAKDHDLFISYKSIDKEFALKLAAAVESESGRGRKLKVFIDEWDIKPGDDIVARIDQALSTSRFIGLVLSPEYLLAEWPTAERNAAVFKDPAGRLGFVVPLMYRRCALPPLLAFRKYVDFSEGNLKRGLPQLLAILKNEPLPRGDAKAVDGHGVPDDGGSMMHDLSAAAADKVPETIHSNLFPVASLPPVIWSAPTEFRRLKDLIEYYQGEIVPPHVIWQGRLYTFADLGKRDHPFLGVVEQFDTHEESTDSWLADGERSRRLVWLLNDCIRVRSARMHMSHDRVGRKYFFHEGVLKETSLLPYGKGKPKGLLFDYTRGSPPYGYKAFRAVKMRFLLLGRQPFLLLESGWVFKTAMNEFIRGRKSIVLNAKFTSTQKNSPNFSEIRFWAWLLSTEKGCIALETGGEVLEIDSQPASVSVPVGIFGDQTMLRQVVEPPDLVLDEKAEAESESDFREDEGDGEEG